MKPNFSFNSNQLQNHPKFITVNGRWAGGTPHNPRTRDHESGVVGYSTLASSNESTCSPLLFQYFSEIIFLSL